ncbi:MAG: DNA-3-methyladenine glycosylase 2 family protein [Ruminococcaceae bacterium]|nr:DNA-3-methyladenine glycosylase 2 family protein [Oscillospiraceae bacterium]
MDYIFKDGGVIIRHSPFFDVERTLDCGQCFRFDKDENNVFHGVAFGKYLRFESLENGDIFIPNMSENEFKDKFISFFAFDMNYEEIISSLVFDKTVKDSLSRSIGIRVLNQEPWEALCSFIISQNNNIPRIKKIVSALCELCGEKVDGCNMKAFPTAQAVYSLGVDGLAPIKSGFRAKYIISAAESVVNGETDFDSLRKSDYETAKKQLMKIKGVGPKVADCALLFGLGFTEAFPVDVWIKRVVSKYYGEGFTPEYFGKYAGIAQQFLFYNERYV